MSKKCVNCEQVLPDNASFCPHCTAAQTEKQEIRTPRQWKKKAAIAAGVLVLAAGISTAFAMYHRPQTYTGGAQIIYPDKDTSYQVLLTYSEGDAVMGNAQSERTDTLAEGMDSALPCQLYALDQESGKLAWETFSEQVESCQISTQPHENSQKMDYSDPAHSDSFPNAAYMSNIHFTSDSGTNDIVWTLTMKNGDTISLSTQLSIEKKAAVTYFPEDVPMETTEDLNALLSSIEKEVSSDTPVYLYLPAVTYDGPVTFGNHTFSVYGSTEGNDVTTFTGTVSMKGLNGNYADLSGIRFESNTPNSETGLNAYCFVLLSNCDFSGWNIAAVAQDRAWVSASDCTFTDNTTALKFTTSLSYGSSPSYFNNTFTGNGTAVRIDSLPGSEVLDFTGSTFAGNDVDIDNPAEHPVDTANAVFE